MFRVIILSRNLNTESTNVSKLFKIKYKNAVMCVFSMPYIFICILLVDHLNSSMNYCILFVDDLNSIVNYCINFFITTIDKNKIYFLTLSSAILVVYIKTRLKKNIYGTWKKKTSDVTDVYTTVTSHLTAEKCIVIS